MTLVKKIQSIARAISVIECLRESSCLSLKDIHTNTGIDKATLMRILATLIDSSWVIRSKGDGRYRLSYVYSSRNYQDSQTFLISEVAADIMKQLHDELLWPSDIAIRNGNHMEVIESTKHYSTFILNRQEVGSKPEMLFSAVGRAYLAFCPIEERAEIIAAIKQSQGPQAKLARDGAWVQGLIAHVKKDQYATREPGFWGVQADQNRRIEAIAVPIFSGEQVLASLSLAWPEGSASHDEIKLKFFPSLNKASHDISEKLATALHKRSAAEVIH